MITQLLIGANKKDMEDRLWQQWIVDYGRMDSEHFISFEDYKKEFIKPEPEKVDIEDVLRDAEKIKAMDQGSQ
jgi:hypothetical protein